MSVAEGEFRDLTRIGGDAVLRSWRRSIADFGLEPAGVRPPDVLDTVRLRERQQALGEHLEFAKKVMEILYQQIAGSGFVVILTDTAGTILASLSEPALRADFERAGLWLGSIWGENHEGTNGIGTCLSELAPISIHREEHFRSRHIHLSCSAAPIKDPNGQLLGVFDASCANSRDTKSSQALTLALVRMSAAVMENRYFLQSFADERIVRFHSSQEFVGLVTEGLLAIDDQGRILAANDGALVQLDQTGRNDLVGRSLEEVLDIRLSDLAFATTGSWDTVWPTREQQRGKQLYAQLRGPIRRREHAIDRRSATVSNRRPQNIDPGVVAPSPLATLAGNDPQMMRNVHRALRLMDRKVPLLISGETGTGKEAFAHAIHEASARATAPFVAVNCAAIPENLIESELFGYEQGAFTGARRQGMRGRMAQSSGGTLFLDEIGDMPYLLQTRLLRVLEEQTVSPLGSDKAIDVDLNVISATHRNLENLVADGTFREDLYYRLNGLTIELPALRVREDRNELIEQILRAESEGLGTITIAPSAVYALRSFQWPGNIRQLRNVLRSACALCEDGVIRLADLPRAIAHTPTSGEMPSSGEGMHVESNVNALTDAERAALIKALDESHWNMTQTSQRLGISRNTLYRKLHRHRIHIERH